MNFWMHGTRRQLKQLKHNEPWCTAFTAVLMRFWGIATDVRTNLSQLEKALEVACEQQLGQWAHPVFAWFANEPATSRVVRITAGLLGGGVDEKNGICNMWLAHCRSESVKSLIGNFRDNRFNGTFDTAAQISHYIPQIPNIINKLENTLAPQRHSLKVQSLTADLRDSYVAAFLKGLAVAYVHTSSQTRVSAHGFRDPGKSAWAEHFVGTGVTNYY